jgi:hypothetical protein
LAARVKDIRKAELKRRNLSYQQLVDRLSVISVSETEPNNRTEIGRGRFGIL